MCSEETKAAAMAALLAGQGISEVARQYNLPKTTVARLRHKVFGRAPIEGLVAMPESINDDSSVSPVPVHENVSAAVPFRRSASELDTLLYEYLTASLRALRVQAEIFADREWLSKQPADELAILHGVGTDKVIRLLESIRVDEPAATGQ